mmetsp:Transcript_93507/g.259883  ORF Transcript_93507/g.259883 Transcript_93507/m.259883 type:complete len:215 (-) Transcript_93507:251-895(-)
MARSGALLLRLHTPERVLQGHPVLVRGRSPVDRRPAQAPAPAALHPLCERPRAPLLRRPPRRREPLRRVAQPGRGSGSGAVGAMRHGTLVGPAVAAGGAVVATGAAAIATVDAAVAAIPAAITTVAVAGAAAHLGTAGAAADGRRPCHRWARGRREPVDGSDTAWHGTKCGEPCGHVVVRHVRERRPGRDAVLGDGPLPQLALGASKSVGACAR